MCLNPRKHCYSFSILQGVSSESAGNLIFYTYQEVSRSNFGNPETFQSQLAIIFQSMSLCYINIINFCITCNKLVEIVFNSLNLLFVVSTFPKLSNCPVLLSF